MNNWLTQSLSAQPFWAQLINIPYIEIDGFGFFSRLLRLLVAVATGIQTFSLGSSFLSVLNF